MKHLSEVAMLLAHDEPFGEWECGWCRYRAIGAEKTANHLELDDDAYAPSAGS
jgi:hypothetical protein